MSKIVSCEWITPDKQKIIDQKLTVRSETIMKGMRQFGIPFKTYRVSDDHKWIAIPFFAAQSLKVIPKKAEIIDFSYYQKKRPHMKFTGSLIENDEKDQITAMKEAEALLQQYNTVTLGLRTGFGKTVCSGYLACKLQYRTLVLMCSCTLIDGWKNDTSDNTNARIMVFDGKKQPSDDIDIVICMIGQLYKLDEDIMTTFGTLVLDEAVDFCTDLRLQEVIKITPKYFICCTATPTRGDKLHCILHLLVGEHQIIRLNQKPFTVIKLLTGVKPETRDTEHGTDWNFLQYDLFLNENRTRIILECILGNYEEHKIMILTTSVTHADLLYTVCKGWNLDVSKFYGDQKSYQNAKILIGTTKKCGVGFDEKSKCATYDGIRIDLLLWVGSTKQPEALTQYIGRVTRADTPNVIHFVDDDKRIKNHWRVAAKLYEKIKGVVQSEEINGDTFYYIKKDDIKKFKELYTKAYNTAISNMYSKQEKTHTKISYLEYLEDIQTACGNSLDK